MDIKVGVLEGGMSIGKRKSIDLGDIIAPKLEADNEREMFERGKTL